MQAAQTSNHTPSGIEITNLTLAYLLLELKPKLEGAFLNKIQAVDREVLKMRFHSKQGSLTVIAAPHALYSTSYSLPASRTPLNFAAQLQKHLCNARLLSARQHNMDRVVVFEFPNHKLIFEFFSHSNIILADHSLKIIACLKRETWKDRTISPGVAYLFPKPKGLNPAEVSEKQLAEIFSGSKREAIRAFISGLNVAPSVAEEIFLRSKVAKNHNADELKPREIAALAKLTSDFHSNISPPRLKPVLSGRLLLPFRLDVLGDKGLKEAESINKALDDDFSVAYLTKEARADGEKSAQETARLQHSLAEQEAAGKRFEAAVSENKAKAELIYRHFPQIERLMQDANSLLKQKLDAKDVMYKLQSLAEKEPQLAKLRFALDVKSRKLTFDLE